MFRRQDAARGGCLRLCKGMGNISIRKTMTIVGNKGMYYSGYEFCQHTYSASCRAAVATVAAPAQVAAVAVAAVEAAGVIAVIAIVAGDERATVIPVVAVAAVAVDAIYDGPRNDKLWIRGPMTTKLILEAPKATAQAIATVTRGSYCSAIRASH